MSNYSQKFTLTDIFNNRRLAGKLPLVNYKEIERENGKTSRRTSMKTVPMLVYQTAKSAAKPFYKPLEASKSGDEIIIDGDCGEQYDEAYEAIYAAIKAQQQLMSFTVNNGDIIRSALKEGEKSRRKTGVSVKLYLRAQSMQQIEGMTKTQLKSLLQNIMENIVYGDDFPETKKKYKAQEIGVITGKHAKTYEEARADWRRRVGLD